jgi:predicted metal-dependent hydrolase
MFNNNLNWPPSYSIIKMQRARHVTIKITLRKGLEFVVPAGFNKNKIPELLKMNKHWIQQQLILISRESKEIRMSPLPTQIDLIAFRQIWKVKYKSSLSDIEVTEDTKQKILTVTGKIKDKFECKKQLICWVKLQARKKLSDKLKKLSIQTNLKFKDVVIRNQAGHWASCSSQKRISLNYKLILLPERLCKYILIHELCHARQFNHSKNFWRLVAKHDAPWKKHNEAMHHSEKLIPAWIREF